MKNLVLYIHGKGGKAAESEHYRTLFPGSEVIGLDYQTFSPWETGAEILDAVTELKDRYKCITLIASKAIVRSKSLKRVTYFHQIAQLIRRYYSTFTNTV